MSKLAVIQFPGSNCEYETARALTGVGFDVDIIRWTVSESEFMAYDAYVLPGGFSYQDRVRAGVVASKLPIISYLTNVVQERKPVLGICNGCQILAEAGLIPNRYDSPLIETALAPNTRGDQSLGFVCDWVFVKPKNTHKSIFMSSFSEDDVIPIPINHGEGHFVFSDKLYDSLDDFSQFVYCDFEGNVSSSYPINPNGSMNNVAGLGDESGCVFAMMPHPERAFEVKQVPFSINSPWVAKKENAFLNNENSDGPWQKFFLSMYDYVQGRS